MPLTEVTTTVVAHACAACGALRRTTLAALKADAAAVLPLAQAPGVLRLPSCECGATEFLVRAPEGEAPHPAPGSYGHRHRLLVDYLHAVVDGTPAPTDEVAQWFPDGLRLPAETPASGPTSPGGGL